MRRPSRRTMLTLALIGALLATAGYSYDRMSAARARAAEAASDTAACRRLQRRIEALRQRPKLAESRALKHPQIAERVEAAAREARIGPGQTANLVRVDPAKRAVRLGNSVYTEKPVHVSLDRIKLEQLFAFMRPLVSGAKGLSGRRIALTAPRGSERGRRWNAELTLTYLIYAPQSGASP